MNGIIKRVKTTGFALLILICFTACACDKPQEFIVYDCFSVNFLYVGEGDAIFINFNDGKTMLIDCGSKNDSNLTVIKQYVNAYSGGTLDYLVLTHPDSDHVGNAADILDRYDVKTAYIPYLLQPENFSAYYPAYRKIDEKGIGKVSAAGGIISGEDYYAVFLSPNAQGTTDSAYGAVNSSDTPSKSDINNVSPIIYLEYKGVKFVFTGDAGVSQEKVALNNVETGIIKRYIKRDINLIDIDFLKVSHHGAADESGEEFLKTLTPKNAVISVGGENYYGHPSGQTLSRIKAASPDCNIYTTSEYGTVSVLIDGSGNITVKTAA